MKLFRKGNKDPNPIIARMLPGEVPVTKYVLPREPKQVTNSWIVGHSVMFYHGLDWVHLAEFWSKEPCIIYGN